MAIITEKDLSESLRALWLKAVSAIDRSGLLLHMDILFLPFSWDIGAAPV